MNGLPTAQEIRREIVQTVSRNGGHLASSLGAVELALALREVFTPERDRILWDVGHQAYAWKILTGRRGRFGTLRTLGGVSPFVNPDESPADAFVAGHAGSAFAAALGMAAARDARGGAEHVVAVVGDASLCNGASFEALNNCALCTRKMILVVNDNAMAISPSRGAVARCLGRLISGVRYNRVKAAVESAGHRLRLTFLRGVYHRAERLLKSIWLGNALFEGFGLRYIGPVDGHDQRALVSALTVAKEDKRGVVVHVVTRKGQGFAPAEADPERWHGVGPFASQAPASEPSGTTWAEVFGDVLVSRARADPHVHGVVAAMTKGTGLGAFADAFPDRFHDLGICESCAVTFAAGLAKAGLRPVVAIYSTFLQRAVDQIMHDVCILGLPVVFAIDRAGCVGRDGRTHHGMFDVALLRCLPGLTVCQPSCADDLRGMLDLAFSSGGPWAIRYPRGNASATPSCRPVVPGRAAQVCGADAEVQIWALGDQVRKALETLPLLKDAGVDAGVVDARFVKPFDTELLRRQRAAGACVVSLENGCVTGGFGEAIGADLRIGWPDVFVGHGSVEELEHLHGLDVHAVAARIADFVSGRFGAGAGDGPKAVRGARVGRPDRDDSISHHDDNSGGNEDGDDTGQTGSAVRNRRA